MDVWTAKQHRMGHDVLSLGFYSSREKAEEILREKRVLTSSHRLVKSEFYGEFVRWVDDYGTIELERCELDES